MPRGLVGLVALTLVAACGSSPPASTSTASVQNSATASAPPVSKERCLLLLDHLIDFEFARAGASAMPHEEADELAAQKASVRESKRDRFVSICTRKMTALRLECALAAGDLPAVDRCDAVR